MPVSLAEIVIAEKLITNEGLAVAVELSEKYRCPLVAYLVHECQVDGVAIVAALTKHIRVETIDPARVEIDTDAMRELRLEDCQRLRALPLSVEIAKGGPKILRVAMADPTDRVGLAELDHLSGCQVEAVLMTLAAVEEMIESAYKQFVTEVMKRGIMSTESTAVTTKPVAKPPTIPFHRISKEASLPQKIDALIKVFVKKELFAQEEYDEILRSVMKADHNEK